MIRATFFALALFALTVTTAHAARFVLEENAQCDGGTLVRTASNVVDAGEYEHFTNAGQMAGGFCSHLARTTPGACCSVLVTTNGFGIGQGPIQTSTWFDYYIYTGSSGTTYTPPDSNGCATNFPGCIHGPDLGYGTQWKYLAGFADSEQQTCVPETRNDQWYTGTIDQTNVFNERSGSNYDCAFWAASEGFTYWNQSTIYRAGEYDPYDVVCTRLVDNPTGSVPKPRVTNIIGVATGSYHEFRSGKACPGAAPPTVTVSLVANPAAIQTGESSLLSWASTNATSCNGTNFATGGGVSGSVVVTPSATTAYTVTCTNGSITASDAETVTVTSPTSPCATPHICSGKNVINSCTGAIIEQCSVSCISGNSGGGGPGSGTGSSGGSGTNQCNIGASDENVWAGGLNCMAGEPVYGLTCPAGYMIVADDFLTERNCHGSGLGSKTYLNPYSYSDYRSRCAVDRSCANGTGGTGGGGNTGRGTDGAGGGGAAGNAYCAPVVTQCSDGLDNDGDGKIDCEDPACHTDGNANNAASCDPNRLENYQCSDTLDNDGDAKADILDPGCHTDANASNASSYDPGDTSEVNTQCSDGIDNDGNGTADYKADGSGDVGCTSLNDNDESSRAELSLALAANASIVQYGSPAVLVWSTTNVRSGSCRITGTNGTDYDFDSGPLGGTSGQVTTTNKPLKSQVTFTLSCKNLSGQTVNTTAVVRVTPRSGEF